MVDNDVGDVIIVVDDDGGGVDDDDDNDNEKIKMWRKYEYI